MAENTPEYVHEYIEIPELFYSSSTGKPFENCISCDAYLLIDGTPYVIEKAIKQYPDYATEDTVFEYAICFNCIEKMRRTYSKGSLRNMAEYFSRGVNMERRRRDLFRDVGMDPQGWIAHCLIKGTGIEQLTEYQICCQCDGSDMIFAHMPFMLSTAALDEIGELLSEQTLGEIDGFVGEHLGLPPEFRSIFNPPRLIVI